MIAIANYNNTVKEYDCIYAASKDLQINSVIIIYSCKNMHKPKKRYTFCYKNHSKRKHINILYIGEMYLQNKIDNLDKQQQAKLAKYISKLEKEKQLAKKQKQIEPKKKTY